MCVSFLLMNWRCTCNIVAIGYFIESVEVAKASGENNNNCEHLFLCHVCDVKSGCGVTQRSDGDAALL